MARVQFNTDRLSHAIAQWRTKQRIAQEMQSLFPHKYANPETPYRALRRAESGQLVDLSTAQCIAAALNLPLEQLLRQSPPNPSPQGGEPPVSAVAVTASSFQRVVRPSFAGVLAAASVAVLL